MMRSHERIEELIAIRSIGGLDPQEQAELQRLMASHGFDCEECRRLEVEYGEAAGRLAFALDPVPLRPGFAEETIGLALGEAPASRPGRAGRWRPLVAVVAAVVLFVAGAAVGAAVFGGGAEVPAQATVLALEPQDPSLAGTVTAAFTPGEAGIYLQGSGLEPLPEDRVYELWVIEGETPAAAICVRPGDDGSVFGFADNEVTGSEVLAVTVEPSSCSDAPTTPPIWAAQVSTA
jgi:Anti-sigma-K factor rskA, C-terminal